MNDFVIAIDGHSGCGKSSTAKAVARALKLLYIDSGAMYRAATLYFLQHQVDRHDAAQVRSALDGIQITFDNQTPENRTILNGRDVEDEIRGLAVSDQVSLWSTITDVRKKLVHLQRQIADNHSVVMDGRDIGTVVFPDADLKVFMTADLKTRAKRRLKEMEENGREANLSALEKNLEERDRIDTQRSDSPLTMAEDAYVIDTSHLSFQEQVDRIVELASKKMG
jgi:cytidylate kinase